MLFTNALTNLFALFFLTLVAFVSGAPLDKKDVYVPPVLYPKTGTVWYVGQRHNVTWDNSNPPTNISNGSLIKLRKGDSTLPATLAQGFDLRAGRVEITVPAVEKGTDYKIVLFGDSGNWSQEFTIN